MPQLQAYLTQEEDAELRDYARSLGLDATALANMLLIRETRLARLKSMPTRVQKANGPRNRKITAHFPLGAQKVAFAEHALACGMKPATAASILLRAELSERWLERSMGRDDLDSI